MTKGTSVKNDPVSIINTWCRLGVGFLYIYHGLIPKIIWLSPIEVELVQLSGTGVSAKFISPFAGLMEIVLELTIIFYRKRIYPVYIAAILLAALLLYTAYVMPSLLVGAFNPMSTNISGLILCFIAIYSQHHSRD